jgi:tetratricopeptide (TPR) repeat protein
MRLRRLFSIWTICDNGKDINHRIISTKAAFEYADAINQSMTPDDFDILYFRACSHVEEGKWEEAVKDANAAIEEKKKFIREKKEEKDEDYMDQTEEFDDAYYIRGLAHMGSKKTKEAIEDFDYCLYLNSEYSDAYNCRGLVYMARKDLPKAEKEFIEALKHMIGDPVFLLNLADCYVRMGRNSDARKQYETCIRIMEDRSDDYIENTFYIRPDNMAFVKRKMEFYSEMMDQLKDAEEYAKEAHNSKLLDKTKRLSL